MLILDPSHCTGTMYRIIHARVWYVFCISFLYSWIDVLDLNQPFNWTAEIWEPFKMKLIWGLQSWTLGWGSVWVGEKCFFAAWRPWIVHKELIHKGPGTRIWGPYISHDQLSGSSRWINTGGQKFRVRHESNIWLVLALEFGGPRRPRLLEWTS